jgi:hypothetical protein
LGGGDFDAWLETIDPDVGWDRSWSTRVHVIVVLHETAQMRDTGVALDRELVHLWTVRDGRGAFLRVFRTRAEALAAAGIEE